MEPFQSLAIAERGPEPGGIYRHYKHAHETGLEGLYLVLVIGRSSEARDQRFVVYLSLSLQEVWIRPLGMFFEHVEVADGPHPYSGPRFVAVREFPSSVLPPVRWLYSLVRAVVRLWPEVSFIPGKQR